MLRNYLFILLLVQLGFSCQKKHQPSPDSPDVEKKVMVPQFNADSSYRYTAEQVAFGPRVPGSEAHRLCGDYLVDRLEEFGALVSEQEAVLRLQDATPLNIRNIIASFTPENSNRLLLFAHWDSRPYADHDPDPANWNTPIDAANDGAGSVAVLLEIARQIGIQAPAMGVDIIFFDAEDWGPPYFRAADKHYGEYCMGSEYWSKNPHIPGYKARYGILLDMVSGPGATFYLEEVSRLVASPLLSKVWKTAHELGFGSYFLDKEMGAIEDDHVQVIRNRKIPCINIVQYDINSPKGFAAFWHTLDDNMNNISKETMQAVGQTVLTVVYNEK